MIQGVIFDMDGLMFDTERIWATLWAPALERLGQPAPTEAFVAGARGLAGPERDGSPGGAFKATFPTAGRDVCEFTVRTSLVCAPLFGGPGPAPPFSTAWSFILSLLRKRSCTPRASFFFVPLSAPGC